MGQEILYCNACGKRLLTDDFTRGRAHTFNHRQYCKECLPKDWNAPSPPAPARPPTQRKKSDRGTRTRPLPVVAPPGASRGSSLSKVYFAFGVGALVAAIAILLALNSSRSADPAPDAPGPAQKPPDPKPDSAKGARQKEQFAAELRELDTRAKPSLDREQFYAVLDLLEEARKRHEAPEWDAAVRKRIEHVRAIPAGLYPSLKVKARNAQLRGSRSELEPLRARVSAWGLKEWTDDLAKALSTVIPREPLPAGAKVLLKFPDNSSVKARPMGARTDAGLVATPQDDAVFAGLENGKEIFKIPEAGEFRMTFTTNKPAQVILICRASGKPDGQDTPYNFWIKNPVVGRPQTIKAPLQGLRDWNSVLIQKGFVVHNIYIRQDDPAATLTIHELVFFQTQE